MSVLDFMKDHILLFDGAMGTMLQKAGIRAGQLPEALNISNPEIIEKIHRQYVEAGSHVATANTFGANKIKLKDSGYSVEEAITEAIRIAKSAGPKYVALDIGPTGQLLKPMGSLSFDDAYDMFAEQVIAGARARADLVIIETFSDLLEAKAAILAVKENSDLPVFCSMTFEEDGRTFVGVNPITASLTLSSLGADAIGMNCSLGPRESMPIVDEILKYSSVPVLVQSNAGLPREENGAAVYNVGPEEYSEHVNKLINMGVAAVGGCCGTTPEYIERISRFITGKKPQKTDQIKITAACSGSKTVIFDNNVVLVGERINPTGKKLLKEAIAKNNIDFILGEAIKQEDAGADILDVNIGLPEINEPEMMKNIINEIQGVSQAPLQIDSSDYEAIEAGVRYYNGRPIINSVNGKRESMDAIFPIAKKYGALLICLTLDENGLPQSAQERYNIAEKIYAESQKYNIPKENLIFDCLTLTVSAQQSQVFSTIDALKMTKERLKVKTALGVSNVSFGLPNRPLLNSTFLSLALGAGLDAAIINPMSQEIMGVVRAFKALKGIDIGALEYVKNYGVKPIDNKVEEKLEKNLSLEKLIIDGRSEQAALTAENMLDKIGAASIIDDNLIPALNKVGDQFERGALFLPQLMKSASAAQTVFEVIRNRSIYDETVGGKGKIILATVEGDIHDIGKNIVKMLLVNHGYEVIDLGKDVKCELVAEAVAKHEAALLGLSALMTTTVQNMKRTIEMVRKEAPYCRIMVGGAVLNSEYAKMVGADYYASNAQSDVRIAKMIFKR